MGKLQAHLFQEVNSTGDRHLKPDHITIGTHSYPSKSEKIIAFIVEALDSR